MNLRTMGSAERAFYLSLGAAVGLLAILCLWHHQWALGLAALAVGIAWGGAHWRGWRWLPPVAFAALVALSAAGLWRQLPAAWLVVAVAAALAAWDLDSFAARLARFAPGPDHARLVKDHLVRLLLVVGAGIALGEVSLVIRLTLGLGVVMGLGLLAFLILTQAARLLAGDGGEAPASKPDGSD